jgi:hypothetical protein
MNLKLFYVRDNDPTMDQDALVLAESAEAATQMWRDTFERDDEDPKYVGEVPGVMAAPDSKPGVIDWGLLNPT